MSSYNIFDSLKSFVEEHKTDIRWFIFLSIAAPISDVILPHYYGKVVDNLSHFPRAKAFTCNKTTICIILFLWSLRQFLHYKLNVLDAKFIPLLTAYFRTQMVEKILFYYEHRPEDPKVGELLSKIIHLPALIRDLFHQIIHTFLPNGMIMLFATAYMFYINTNLGTLMAIGIATFLCTAYSFLTDTIEGIKQIHLLYDDLHEEIIDVLSNMSTVFSVNTVKQELAHLSDRQVSYGKVLQKGIEDTGKFKLIFNTTYFGMFVSIGYYTIYLYKTGKISIANATSVLLVLLFCLMGLNDISNIMRDFIFNVAGLMEMQKYLDEIFVDRGESDGLVSEEKVDFLQPIRFDHITVNVGDKTVYDDFSAVIPPRKLTGIIGQVGKGKSTLLKTLLRIQTLTTGSIFIGRVNTRQISTPNLRGNIAYVPQTITLFNRTILQNITYGVKNVGERDVGLLIQNHGIIEISTKDFPRLAGKGGCNLSGGQKQIILILRALLKKTPIMLLDEPTSALSTQSRMMFFRLLRQINDGTRTIIISTHDEDLMRMCDNILEI